VSGHATPSFYNPIELEKVKNSSPKYDWKLSKTVRIQPLKKTPAGNSETSPHSYNTETAKQKVGQTSPRYSYGKEKGKSFIQAYQASKSWVPAPSAYNLDKAYNRITIGARKGYK
jgi:hypothetical protein